MSDALGSATVFLDRGPKLGLQEFLQPGMGEDVPPANCFEVQALLFHSSFTGLGLGTLRLTCWSPGSLSRAFSVKAFSEDG